MGATSYSGALSLLSGLAVWVGGCASGGVQPSLPDVVPYAPSGATEAGTGGLRDLPAVELETQEVVAQLPPALTEPRYDLRVRDESLRSVLLALAFRSGLNFVIAPDVEGSVTADLTGVSLVRALEYLLTPLNFDYHYERGAIWITKRRLETRVFSVNYPITGRAGAKTLAVGAGAVGAGVAGGAAVVGGVAGAGAVGVPAGAQVAPGQVAGAPAGIAAGALGAGFSTIGSASAANFFSDLRDGLETLIFGAVAAPAQAAGARAGLEVGRAGLAGLMVGGAVSEFTAFSRRDEAGRELIFNPFAGLVLVRAEPEILDRVAAYIEAVSGSANRQVLIEAQIIEVELSDEYRAGIDWSLLTENFGLRQILVSAVPSGAAAFRFEATAGRLGAVLDALSTMGKLHTLSSPRVSTLSNQKVVLQATTQEVFFASQVTAPVVVDGTVIPGERQFFPQVIPVGVVVDVTPQVSEDGEIIMDIRPSVTEVVRIAESPRGDQTPVVDVRTMDTMAKVRSGETIVIGGLIDDEEEVQVRKVPLLGDLPLLGALFRSTERQVKRSQLVIFITPVVQAGRRIEELTAAQRRQLGEMIRR